MSCESGFRSMTAPAGTRETNGKFDLSKTVTSANTAPYISTIVPVWTDGDETSGTLSGNYYTFSGRRYDPEGELYYYRNRYYSWGLGRFVTRDPIGYAGGMHLYVAAFVPNYLDPEGLDLTQEDCYRIVREAPDADPEIEEYMEGLASHKPHSCAIHLECVPCCKAGKKGGEIPGGSTKVSSGYPKTGICTMTICLNSRKTQNEANLRLTFKHELIHCVQACIGLLDRIDCDKCVCLEIQSSFNSGECKPGGRDWDDRVDKSISDCVKREAAKSCERQGHCKSLDEAKAAAKKLYIRCRKPPFTTVPVPAK